MKSWKQTARLLALALVLSTSQGAALATGPGTGTIDLTLSVTGHIAPRCGIVFDRNRLDVAFDDRPGGTSVGFTIDCNQVPNISVTTSNGGFKLRASEGFVASPGFISLLPYDLALSIETAGAQRVMFESAAIQQTPGIGSFGVVPFVSRGALDLAWSPSLPLIGGDYGDVIEIRVSGQGETNGPG